MAGISSRAKLDLAGMVLSIDEGRTSRCHTIICRQMLVVQLSRLDAAVTMASRVRHLSTSVNLGDVDRRKVRHDFASGTSRILR